MLSWRSKVITTSMPSGDAMMTGITPLGYCIMGSVLSPLSPASHHIIPEINPLIIWPSHHWKVLTLHSALGSLYWKPCKELVFLENWFYKWSFRFHYLVHHSMRYGQTIMRSFWWYSTVERYCWSTIVCNLIYYFVIAGILATFHQGSA